MTNLDLCKQCDEYPAVRFGLCEDCYDDRYNPHMTDDPIPDGDSEEYEEPEEDEDLLH